jgi:hypothetical protein
MFHCNETLLSALNKSLTSLPRASYIFRLLGTVARPARLPPDRPAFTPTLITNSDISAAASERNHRGKHNDDHFRYVW